MRPRFLDQPSWWSRTPRELLSRADDASPVTRYVNARGGCARNRLVAGALLIGLLAVLFGGAL